MHILSKAISLHKYKLSRGKVTTEGTKELKRRMKLSCNFTSRQTSFPSLTLTMNRVLNLKNLEIK